MGYKLIYSVISDKGSREVNEDSADVFTDDSRCCCILCDGLGGHGMGDIASSLTVSVFKSQFSKNIKPDIFLSETLTASQDILLAEQMVRNAKRKMKTTAAAVFTTDRKAYIGHIGDSRVYIFYKNKTIKRTSDHSIPEMLYLSGEIKENEIRNHPDRSSLLKVLGTEWSGPEYQLLSPIPLRKCQAFLICSDGFWELIEESKMAELLYKSETPEQWLNFMKDIVTENGKDKNMDNFSAIAAWVVKK